MKIDLDEQKSGLIGENLSRADNEVTVNKLAFTS